MIQTKRRFSGKMRSTTDASVSGTGSGTPGSAVCTSHAPGSGFHSIGSSLHISWAMRAGPFCSVIKSNRIQSSGRIGKIAPARSGCGI
jgi:hypothetical protein